MAKDNEVIFIFPDETNQETTESMIALGEEEKISKFSATLEDIKKWFSGFDVKEVEIRISGGISTAGFTKLFISAKGEGGIKIILTPKHKLEAV
jgi:hypothetical protein